MIDEVITAADSNYGDVLKVMLVSLVRHGNLPSSVPITVLTLQNDLRVFEGDRWYSVLGHKIRFRAVDELPDELPVYGHVSKLTYARLHIPKVVAASTHRVLYIDADTMIRSSLNELWEHDWLRGRPLAAVHEAGTSQISMPGGIFNWQELGLPGDLPYFNAGVLLLDVDAVRQSGDFEKVIAYMICHGRRIISWDQGGLNAIFANNWGMIPSRYNWSTALNQPAIRRRHLPLSEQNPNDAVIVHFSGSGMCKPWHVNCLSPFRHEYRELMREINFEPTATSRLEDKIGRGLSFFIRLLMAKLRGHDTLPIKSVGVYGRAKQ
jgi:lipopolysaccharide biosynthesis glycosyltransferase